MVRSVVLQVHTDTNCKRDRLWVRYPFEEMKYLIFLFSRSGNEAKRVVKLRHLSCKCLHNSAKIGNGAVLMVTKCLNTRFLLPILLCAG